MGIIRMHQIEFETSHGYYEEERMLKQKFMLNIDIHTDVNVAAMEDDIDGTINYEEVYHICEEIMHTPVKLLEHLAHNVITAIKASFPQIDTVQVELQKRDVQLGGKLEYVSVILKR